MFASTRPLIDALTDALLAATLVVLVFAAGGCGEADDRPSKVTDLRVLAISAQPPEILYDRATGRFSEDVVTFEALVVDPRGHAPGESVAPPLALRWSFCPVESAEGCRDYEATRASAPEPLRPLLDGLRQQRLEGAGTRSGAPTAGRAAFDVPLFAARLDPALVDYHLQASALGGGNGAWISGVLEAGAGEAVVAHKRVLLGVRDLAAYNPELRTRFGFTICEEAGDPGPRAGTAADADAPAPDARPTDGPCLALPARRANRNPALTAITVSRGGVAGRPFEPLPEDGVLRVRPGEKVRLLPVLAPEAEETYHTLEPAFEGHALVVIQRQEQAVVSWFATAGSFGNDVTSSAFTKTLDNVFTAPDAPPAGGALSVWAVVRDGRGGTGWRHLAVEVGDDQAALRH
jgi:hypothetical protein